MTSPGNVPRATYRIQFNAGFTLGQATELVPYLRDLGVSHLYASPLLKAMPGSTHGSVSSTPRWGPTATFKH